MVLFGLGCKAKRLRCSANPLSEVGDGRDPLLYQSNGRGGKVKMVLFAMQEAPAIVRFSARRRSRGRLAGRAISLALLRGGLGEFPAPPGFSGLGWVREKKFFAGGRITRREISTPRPSYFLFPLQPNQAKPDLVAGWPKKMVLGLACRLGSGRVLYGPLAPDKNTMIILDINKKNREIFYLSIMCMLCIGHPMHGATCSPSSNGQTPWNHVVQSPNMVLWKSSAGWCSGTLTSSFK